MTERAITSQVTIDTTDRRLGGARQVIVANNFAFKRSLANWVYWAWCGNQQYTNTNHVMSAWPWRAHPAMAAEIAPAAGVGGGTIYPGRYPWTTGSWPVVLNTIDYSRWRAYNATAGSFAQADSPLSIAAIAITHGMASRSQTVGCRGNMLSFLDLGISQIGSPYMHPAAVSTAVTTTAGQGYVTSPGWGWGYNGWQHLSSCVRIESGLDRGVYYFQNWDKTNGRWYLMNMDGTKFVAQTTGAQVATIGYRGAFFNETSIIPNSGGTVSFDGIYDPGESRDSKILRVHFDKSGSCSPTNEDQRGNYWVSVRGFLGGHGAFGTATDEDSGSDNQHIADWTGYNAQESAWWNTNLYANAAANNQVPMGFFFDRARQRLWTAIGGPSSVVQSIGYINYKSPEGYREVCGKGGTYGPNVPLQPTPFTIPTGSWVKYIDGGSDGAVYVVIVHGTDASSCGWLKINPDLTYTWASAASVGFSNTNYPGPNPVDRTRARTGTAGDVSTTAAGHIQSASGAFTAADLGRCIKVTGTTDAGTYLISSIVGAGEVTATLLNGTAVTFTGGTGGTFQIGDRIYIFAHGPDAAFNANKMSYFDSLSFGIKFTKTVTMTNGAISQVWTHMSGAPTACIDQVTGNVLWASSDTTRYINKYDVSAGTVQQRLFSTLATQVSGSSHNPVAPTVILTLAANPHPSFRELWIGTEYGHYKFDVTDLSLPFKRFLGRGDGRLGSDDGSPAVYTEPPGLPQTSGLSGTAYLMTSATMGALNHSQVHQYQFAIDGQVYAFMGAQNVGYGVQPFYIVHFNREVDNWWSAYQPDSTGLTSLTSLTNVYTSFFLDPYGGAFVIDSQNFNAAGDSRAFRLWYPASVHYQWDGTKWFPKEVVRSVLPDGTSGCLTKPLHTTSDELLFGVRVKFTSSGNHGSDTVDNLDFLGRTGRRGLVKNDGATTSAANSFGGSGFTALGFNNTSDPGRYFLRIESGSDPGVYVISNVASDTALTLKKVGGAAWTATTTGATLQYTIWDMQAPPVCGPECCSVLLANGFGKDNTQDVNNIVAETFLAKTLLSEQQEAVKFATNYLPPPGSGGISFYPEGVAGYDSAIQAHRALASSALAAPDALLGAFADHANVGTVGWPDGRNGAAWRGLTVAAASGGGWTIDFGTDVEVGSILVRAMEGDTGYGSPNQWIKGVQGTDGGFLGHWMKANNGAAPVSSTANAARCSGTTNLATTSASTTISLSSGDFLGTATAVTGSDGVATSGSNIFSSSAGRFSPTNVGMILKVTSGTDAGSYRILTVSGDGSQVTVRNLDQSAKAFAAGSAIAFTVYNGVQEEDCLYVPSRAVPTYKLSIERLLTPTTAQIRLRAASTLAAQSWECAAPTWQIVKRISQNAMGGAPDVVNNGTWISYDGFENFVTVDGCKVFADFSDLSAAQRTGRYWKLAGLGRMAGSYNTATGMGLGFEFLDPSGKRIGLIEDTRLATFTDQAQFMSSMVSRVDFIQSSNSAAVHVPGVNGLASLALGPNGYGDTVTLAGGNKFLGYTVRAPGAGGTVPGGSNVFNGGAGDPPFSLASDAGRFLRITSGVNAGIYRIFSVVSTTQVTLVSPAGNATTLSADAGPVSFQVHSGINVGTSNPDYLVFLPGGVNQSGLREYSIKSISDDLTTLTLNDHPFTTLSGQSWEIRRRGNMDWSGYAANGGVSARVVTFGPAQSGDVYADSRGQLWLHPQDVVSSASFTLTGATTGGNTLDDAHSPFAQDMVGRAVIIASGVNKGSYKIATYVSATQVTLVDAFTGAAAAFTADAALTYKLLGERRFRLARYLTVLRQ
jgi:hypothetical protein